MVKHDEFWISFELIFVRWSSMGEYCFWNLVFFVKPESNCPATGPSCPSRPRSCAFGQLLARHLASAPPEPATASSPETSSPLPRTHPSILLKVNSSFTHPLSFQKALLCVGWSFLAPSDVHVNVSEGTKDGFPGRSHFPRVEILQ